MAVEAAAVSVATTATALNDGTENVDLLLHNNGSVTVYLGPLGVTTSSGVPLAAGEKLAANGVAGGEILYGRVASGTCEVRVLRTGVIS